MCNKAHCYYCLNSNYVRGSLPTYEDPGEPDMIECNCEDIPEEFFEESYLKNKTDDETYEYNAKNCGHFNPRIIEKCGHCRNPINKPENEWKLWVNEFYSGEAVPVCSDKCKEEYTKKQEEIAAEIAAMPECLWGK